MAIGGKQPTQGVRQRLQLNTTLISFGLLLFFTLFHILLVRPRLPQMAEARNRNANNRSLKTKEPRASRSFLRGAGLLHRNYRPKAALVP